MFLRVPVQRPERIERWVWKLMSKVFLLIASAIGFKWRAGDAAKLQGRWETRVDVKLGLMCN